jgi:hypothetical protein
VIRVFVSVNPSHGSKQRHSKRSVHAKPKKHSCKAKEASTQSQRNIPTHEREKRLSRRLSKYTHIRTRKGREGEGVGWEGKGGKERRQSLLNTFTSISVGASDFTDAGGAVHLCVRKDTKGRIFTRVLKYREHKPKKLEGTIKAPQPSPPLSFLVYFFLLC